jgi:hypothetical protein
VFPLPTERRSDGLASAASLAERAGHFTFVLVLQFQRLPSAPYPLIRDLPTLHGPKIQQHVPSRNARSTRRAALGRGSPAVVRAQSLSPAYGSSVEAVDLERSEVASPTEIELARSPT